MRMCDILTAKTDDFSIATGRCMVIFTTILTQETFHQPCFGEVRRNVEYSIEKDLRYFPTFF